MIQALKRVLLAGTIAALSMPSGANPAWLGDGNTIGVAQAPTERDEAASAPEPARLTDLLIHAISMIGVKYKYGGNSAQIGFDCSGFVRHVFAESLALDLPRSSQAMGKLGLTVASTDLHPGDLVFYNTRRSTFSHVGIYLGEGRFVHAPSRGKSVEIVNMTESYWKSRFNGARRIIFEN